jgi:glycosyltransferase involved in cell wall biosynthesis
MNLSPPTLTTIIPTYRRPQLLKRAIACALAQTYPHIEVHVYDNASQDETEDVVRAFIIKDSRVHYHCHAENIGMMANYETALKAVKTPYFSFLSDDDLIFPWYYETVMRGFEEDPEVALSAGSTLIMNEEGRVIRVPLDLWKKEGKISPPDSLLEMISKYPVPTCVVFKKEKLEQIAIDRQNSLTWDCDFQLQVAARFPIFIQKRPCGIFLHHEKSYSNAQNFLKWEASLKHLTERIRALDILSDPVKEKAIELIQSDLKAVNRAFILRSLFGKNLEEAYDCAQIYRKRYHVEFESSILLTLSRLCRICPPFVYFLRMLRGIKHWRNRQFEPYQHYAKWLQEN